MATGIVTQFVRTAFETAEGRVDIVRAGKLGSGYTFKVYQGVVERANRAEELRLLDEAKANPIIKKLRSGSVVRGSLSRQGERVSVSTEVQLDLDLDIADTAFVSADECGNLSITLVDLDLNLTYGQYVALKKLLSGTSVDRLVETAQEWCQAA